MPVFEEFPYTNFHELNLDWLIRELLKIKAGIIDTESLKQYRIFDQVKYYIDGVNGDDDNPGTSAKPFRTLDRFMKLSEQYSAIEGHIIEAGSYRITDGSTMSGLDVRILGDVAGVNVYLHGDDDVDYYHVFNSHLHLENITAYVQNGANVNGNIIGVNAVIALYNASLPEGRIECNGGELIIQIGTVKRCILHNSFGRFYRTTIANTDPAANGYDFVNSFVEMQKNNYTTALTADGASNAIINAVASHIAMRGTFASPASTGTRYYNAVQASYCTILLNSTVESVLDASCVAASDLTKNLKQTITE